MNAATLNIGDEPITLDDAAARALQARLTEFLERPKEQTFTVTVVVPDYVAANHGEVNIYEVKNHVRKYVAAKLNCATSFITTHVAKGGGKSA